MHNITISLLIIWDHSGSDAWSYLVHEHLGVSFRLTHRICLSLVCQDEVASPQDQSLTGHILSSIFGFSQCSERHEAPKH